MKKVFVSIALLVLACSAVFAASYVVPPDDVFIRKADGVIVARALTSYVRETPESGIETVTEFTVEESIEGEISTAHPLRVHIPGGVIDGRAKIIPGAPQFADGGVYLLFLSKRPAGGFATTDFALGVFSFVYDDLGRRVAVRDDAEIVGWDVDGRPHHEARRDAGRFLDYVRQVARGGHPAADYRIDSRPLVGSMRVQSESNHRAAPAAVYTATSYTFIIGGSLGTRWANFPGAVNWNQGSTQVAAGTTAIDTAFSSWAGGGGNVNFKRASQTPNSKGIIDPADGINNIVFEEDLTSAGVPAFSCSSGGVLGLGGVNSASSSLNTQNGESFWTTNEGDVSMNKGVGACIPANFSAGDFNSAVTHEVGHALGWRHADKTRAFSSPESACSTDPSLECASSAIMTAFVTSGLNGSLRTWDQHAVQLVYGSGAPPCTAPSITVQPAGSTIASGASANLSVTATGSTPLSYQWYKGTTGTITTPVGTNSSTFNTGSLTATTSYWVRVTGQCSPVADSNTATITVTAACTPPSITVQPAGSTIASGQSANLSVTATGTATLSYQWYIGSTGNTSTPTGTNSSSFNTGALTTSTSYWVRVTGQCTPVADSNTATVIVTGGTCTPPSITGQPSGSTIASGQSANLSVTATGTAPLSYQWYAGSTGTTSAPVTGGTSSSISVSPASTTSYWVRVTGQCSPAADSSTATVTVSGACPSITVSTPTAVQVAGGFTLSATASGGSGLTFSWLQVLPSGGATLVAIGNPITVNPSSATTYFVRVSNNCGTNADSPQITVTPSSTCSAPAISSVVATPSSISAGATSTLSVVATGSSLNYQWYAGQSGNTSSPVAGGNAATVNVSPSQTTTYWVQVSSGCGAQPANSTAVTVSVTVCVTTTFTQPSNQTIVSLQSATITIAATGLAPLHYQWYRGGVGDATHPVGTDSATFNTGALTSTTGYWVKITNACGTWSSNTILISVVPPGRRRSAHH